MLVDEEINDSQNLSPWSEFTTAVIPAHAGIQGFCFGVFFSSFNLAKDRETKSRSVVILLGTWIPAFAGMTSKPSNPSEKRRVITKGGSDFSPASVGKHSFINRV